MTASAFIATGILESYCLGFTDDVENATIEKMALDHPEVRLEIARIRESLSRFLLRNQLQPSSAVKTNVMQTIYSQQASEHKAFVPLMHKPADFNRYIEAVLANALEEPEEDFENIYVRELPSTKEVINFAVWAKQGHEQEAHDDRNEYLAILSGSCEMHIDGSVIPYSQGQIISIPAGAVHHAIVTSPGPMFALVQRQLI